MIFINSPAAKCACVSHDPTSTGTAFFLAADLLTQGVDGIAQHSGECHLRSIQGEFRVSVWMACAFPSSGLNLNGAVQAMVWIIARHNIPLSFAFIHRGLLADP
jgi:hypothetical protein